MGVNCGRLAAAAQGYHLRPRQVYGSGKGGSLLRLAPHRRGPEAGGAGCGRELEGELRALPPRRADLDEAEHLLCVYPVEKQRQGVQDAAPQARDRARAHDQPRVLRRVQCVDTDGGAQQAPAHHPATRGDANVEADARRRVF